MPHTWQNPGLLLPFPHIWLCCSFQVRVMCQVHCVLCGRPLLVLTVKLFFVLLLSFSSSWAYAPFQVLKHHGIKGPQPLPFFGNYKEIRESGVCSCSNILFTPTSLVPKPCSGFGCKTRLHYLDVVSKSLCIWSQQGIMKFNEKLYKNYGPVSG